MMINTMKNYGALVNSISSAMVDKARGNFGWITEDPSDAAVQKVRLAA